MARDVSDLPSGRASKRRELRLVRRVIAVVVALIMVELVLVGLAVVFDHWRMPIYWLPSFALAIAVVSALAVIAGACLLIATDVAVVLAVLVVSGLILFGLASLLLPIGIVALALSAGPAYWLVRRSYPRMATATVSALLILFGAIGMDLVAGQPPIVSCLGGGFTTNSHPFADPRIDELPPVPRSSVGVATNHLLIDDQPFVLECRGHHRVGFHSAR